MPPGLSRLGKLLSFLCPYLAIVVASVWANEFLFRHVLPLFYPLFHSLPVWHLLLIAVFPLWNIWNLPPVVLPNANRRSRVILNFLSLFFALVIQLAPSPRPVPASARIWWSSPGNFYVIKASDLKLFFFLLLLNPYIAPFFVIWTPSFTCILVLDSNHSYLLLPATRTRSTTRTHIMSGPPLHPPAPPSSRLSPSTVTYADRTPDESVVCPICHDPVVAESVVFSCHKHVPYCADCVATWVWRCVTTRPRLTGFPTCPHCRSLVVVDEHFKPNRGRWLEEYGATGAAGASFAATSTGSDRDWYERYLLDMGDLEDDEDYSDIEDEFQFHRDVLLGGPRDRGTAANELRDEGANASASANADAEEAEDDDELSELDDDDFNDLSQIDREAAPGIDDMAV